MHREVKIKHDLMTCSKCNTDGLRHETSGLCEKTNSIYMVFTSCNHSHVQVICASARFLFYSISGQNVNLFSQVLNILYDRNLRLSMLSKDIYPATRMTSQRFEQCSALEIVFQIATMYNFIPTVHDIAPQ